MCRSFMAIRRITRRPSRSTIKRLILYGCGDFLNDYEGIRGYEEFRSDLALMYFADIEPTTGNLAAFEIVASSDQEVPAWPPFEAGHRVAATDAAAGMPAVRHRHRARSGRPARPFPLIQVKALRRFPRLKNFAVVWRQDWRNTAVNRLRAWICLRHEPVCRRSMAEGPAAALSEHPGGDFGSTGGRRGPLYFARCASSARSTEPEDCAPPRISSRTSAERSSLAPDQRSQPPLVLNEQARTRRISEWNRSP